MLGAAGFGAVRELAVNTPLIARILTARPR
jgi:hypothetical protein